MFVWTLILGCWIALLSLILHDATKNDSDGSAVSSAAKQFGALVHWTMQRAAPAAKATTMIKAGSLSDPGPQGGTTANDQAPARPLKRPKKKWWHKENRAAMTAPELELAITDAVKAAAPGCEDFLGVIVEHTTPKSRLDPNWDVRGVKFGKADRQTTDKALASVVERMQREFLLSED
jgi:hypothetical protein